MSTMHNTHQIKRRGYSKRFKAELMAECLTGKGSIALRHDINPNLAHHWVTENRRYDPHELSELSELENQNSIPVTSSNWRAAVPFFKPKHTKRLYSTGDST